MARITISDFINDNDCEGYVKMTTELVSRNEALRGGRLIRMAIVQWQFNERNLTESQARELLRANLTPDDDSTFVDDSDQLVLNMKAG